MKRFREDWPRWAQIGGVLLGCEQLIAWWGFGHEPNLGAITFAGALMMFQRVAKTP